jgi:hypothetical protein
MNEGVLDEQQVSLESGARKAVATFRRYDIGWEIYLIEEAGQPDTGDSDSLFPTLDAAVAGARQMWP